MGEVGRSAPRLLAGILVAAMLSAAVCRAAAADAPVPARIVSLAPSVTETLFALGAGPEVAGVSQYCDYPPEVQNLPRVGSFLTPNIEAIVALRPTLIIGLGLSSDVREIRALGGLGYPVMMTRGDSLREIEASIAEVGDRIGRAGEARALLARINAQVTGVREHLAGARAERVVMLVGHEPIVAVGAGTYLDDLLKLARAENIAEASGEQWPRLSLEYIIAMRPEVILDGQMGSEAATPSHFWDKFTSIPAVRNHRVLGYGPDPILHPGPRVGTSLEILAAAIHPEAFGKREEAAK